MFSSGNSQRTRPRRANDGRHYQAKAIDLIMRCQKVFERDITSLSLYQELLDAQILCDLAINRAIDTRDQETTFVELYFEVATKTLKKYDPASQAGIRSNESNRHNHNISNTQNHQQIPENGEGQKSSPTKTKKRSRKKGGDDDVEIKIRISKTLSDPDPTDVPLKLHSKVGSPMVAEIIWKLGHSEDNSKSHITLAQNPQFYRELYTSPSMYDANFVRESVYEYDEEKKEICVLTKNLNEVLPVFERVPPMVLDGIWFTNNTIIVRDTRGNLLGQSKVSNSITAQELNHHRLKFSKTN